MGTPDFASRVLARVLLGRHRVTAAVCQPDRPSGRDPAPRPPPVKVMALARDLPVRQPRNLGERFQAWLRDEAPDAVLVAAYGRLLPLAVLAMPRFGCLNVHPSLLPRHRGPAPIQWAIASRDRQTGVSIMQMDEGLDTGDVLRQVRVPLTAQDTAGPLHDRLADLGGDLLLEVLDSLEDGRPPVRMPQDPAAATLAPMLSRESGLVDWNADAASLEARLRGFHPWPGCWTRFRGRILKLFPPALATPEDAGAPPGALLGLVDGRGLGVACGAGSLWLRQVQLEGRRPVEAAAFVHGARPLPGEALGDG